MAEQIISKLDSIEEKIDKLIEDILNIKKKKKKAKEKQYENDINKNK